MRSLYSMLVAMSVVLALCVALMALMQRQGKGTRRYLVEHHFKVNE